MIVDQPSFNKNSKRFFRPVGSKNNRKTKTLFSQSGKNLQWNNKAIFKPVEAKSKSVGEYFNTTLEESQIGKNGPEALVQYKQMS